ncbi:6-carboxyhexanoate--CoA ligase [Alkalihalobacillus sp. 1P02AB]|uniref:6-carboxyhexanoate--CoA ligase n=1 Tax=Alkalihalobacillus sp. 1P02AB TaxID=3132260 RepID=UPI0039A61CFF
MEQNLYSIRMRAAKGGAHKKGGKHISGGEMLLPYEEIKKGVNTLIDKGFTHSKGKPNYMKITVEQVESPVQLLAPLHININEVKTVQEGQQLAQNLLIKSGVPQITIEKAYHTLSLIKEIRGAILIDNHSGERVDGRAEKGVRVSQMDWNQQHFMKWAQRQNIPFNVRLLEALSLATKVANHPNTIAELCWSDDPDYITGYVASKELGYQRISKLKNYGDERGCRIFFIDCSTTIGTYIHYLEKIPVLLDSEENNDR